MSESSRDQAARTNAVLPVSDWSAAVEGWTALLGTAPTFVDGDRWAQFDVAGTRIALAGSDRLMDRPWIMVKYDDLDAAASRLRGLGFTVGSISVGAHERTCVVTGPDDVPIVLYEPLA